MSKINQSITADRARLAVTAFLKPDAASSLVLLRESVSQAINCAFLKAHSGNRSPLLAMIERASEGKGAKAKALYDALTHVDNAAQSHIAACKAKTAVNENLAVSAILLHFDGAMQAQADKQAESGKASAEKSKATREAKASAAQAESDKAEKEKADTLAKLAQSFTVSDLIAGILDNNPAMVAIGARIEKAMLSAAQHADKESAKPAKARKAEKPAEQQTTTA